jgi:hypothetical protein
MKSDFSISTSFAVNRHRADNDVLRHLSTDEIAFAVQFMQDKLKTYTGVLNEYEKELRIRIRTDKPDDNAKV